MEESIDESSGYKWQENLDKGLNHFGNKKTKQSEELDILHLKVGSTFKPSDVVERLENDKLVKKYFKITEPKFPTERAKKFPKHIWTNSSVMISPKTGYFYRLYIGTGQFEYFALAIKPGKVFIFRQFDLKYNVLEYIKAEEGLPTKPDGSFDMIKALEEQEYEGIKLGESSPSHALRIAWGILDLPIKYTQLSMFDESKSLVNIPTFEKFINEDYLQNEARGYLMRAPVEVTIDHITYDSITEYPKDSLEGIGGLEYLDTLGKSGSRVSVEGTAKQGRRSVIFNFDSDGPNGISNLEISMGKGIDLVDIERELL